MPELATTVPAHRPELVIRPLGERGRYVVKDPHTGAYFQLGEQEHFLLRQLDGLHGETAVCLAFKERFGQPLTESELRQFIGLARAQGFLTLVEKRTQRPDAGEAAPRPGRQQSILYWRKNIFDPDSLFTRL